MLGAFVTVFGILGMILIVAVAFWVIIGFFTMLAASTDRRYRGDRVPNIFRMWYNFGYFI